MTSNTRLKVRIKDQAFAHDLSSSVGKHPTHFDWVRDNEPVDRYTFVTDRNLQNPQNFSGIAWLLEPRSIQPDIYQFVHKNYHRWNCILTYDRILLNFPNASFVPFGTTRIPISEFSVYPKTKMCSIILSNKTWLPRHKFRHECKNLAKEFSVDIFQPEGDDYIDKMEACKDYRFSIVAENSNEPSYFSEKIMDCFVSGVIPIYSGTSDISDFFDGNGIIPFESLNVLRKILNNLTVELYEEKLQAIRDNFLRAKYYVIPEDYIWLHYPELFPSTIPN